MVEDDFEEDAFLDYFIVVELGESEEEGGDQVIEYLVVVLFLAASGESAINRHIIFIHNLQNIKVTYDSLQSLARSLCQIFFII